MSALTVADLMTSSPICVQAEDTLRTAYEWMENERFRHLPVVDEDGSLVGVLSQRDLVKYALAELDGMPMDRLLKHLEKRRVESAMVASAECAAPDDPIADAAERMLENKWGCLPVCEGDRVVGILTESDFVRYVFETQREEG